ncbi:unnamed protein product [Staurois parvus]|uniref:Uncharacterized protein n=1 Tax=Staurois parvus TaxID=386267 RepID=A0ABN9EX97_9NEOB|nr:unnamed protein product [Staurois parvus]
MISVRVPSEECRLPALLSSRAVSATLIISVLIISVAPSVLPFSSHNCCLSVPINAIYQCISMPHTSAHQSCLSGMPISASQCHLSVPISAT